MKKISLFLVVVVLHCCYMQAWGQNKFITKRILFYAITDDLKNSFISNLKNYTYYQNDSVVKFSVYDIKSLKNKFDVEAYLTRLISNLNSDITFTNKDKDTTQVNYLLNFDYILTLQANKPLDKIIEFNIDVYKTNKNQIDQNFPFLDKSSSISKTILFSENDLTSELLDKKITNAYRYIFNPEKVKVDFSLLTSNSVIIRGDTIFAKRFDTLEFFTGFINEAPINYANYNTVFSVFNDTKSDNVTINNEVKILGSNIDKIILLFNKSGVYKLKQKVYNLITTETTNKYYTIKIKENALKVTDIGILYSSERNVIDFLKFRKKRMLQTSLFNIVERNLINTTNISITSEGERGYKFYYNYDSSNIYLLPNLKERKASFQTFFSLNNRFEIMYSKDTASRLGISPSSGIIQFNIPSSYSAPGKYRLKNTILFDNLYSVLHIEVKKYDQWLSFKPALEFENYFIGTKSDTTNYISVVENKHVMLFKYWVNINLFNWLSIEISPSLPTNRFFHIDSTEYILSEKGIDYSAGMTFRFELAIGPIIKSQKRIARYRSGFACLQTGIQSMNIVEKNNGFTTKTRFSYPFVSAFLEVPILESLLNRLIFFYIGGTGSLLNTKHISTVNKNLVITQGRLFGLTFGLRLPVL